MPNGTEARAAIARLNGTLQDGRALTVNEARPREERDGHGVAVVSAGAGEGQPPADSPPGGHEVSMREEGDSIGAYLSI